MEKRTYQNTIAILFALAWGFVILDRQAITFLFPTLMETFNLNNAQTGDIVMVTGLGFVISSLFITPLADRSGLKKVWLVPVVILAGLFSGCTAIAGSLMVMLVVRFLTGFADGPAYPLMTSVLTIQGDPKKFASYIGLMQFSIGLIAMVLGPTLTIQLALHLNWQYAFIFTSLPTVIIGILIWFVLKEVQPPRNRSGRRQDIRKICGRRYRNEVEGCPEDICLSQLHAVLYRQCPGYDRFLGGDQLRNDLLGE